MSRLGIEEHEHFVSRALSGSKPIRIAMGATGISTLALFGFLRDIRGYNIELDCSYAETTEISQRLSTNRFAVYPDGCVLTLPATATYLGKVKQPFYKPYMLLSRSSHSVVVPPGGNTDLNYGQYLFMAERPGNGMFYFESMIEKGLISKSNVDVRHMEPDDVLSVLGDENSAIKAILFFPHDVINVTFNQCKLIQESFTKANTLETVLLLSESVLARANIALAINIAIRDAWLSMLEEPQLLVQVISKLFYDERFVRLLSRCSGLYKYTLQSEALHKHPGVSPVQASSASTRENIRH